ncbi:S-crystallin SL11-like isoform X2 [Pecten maximus]|uniref:S-crystallin SL11-like isoform X2 n=1 Tax=Pecten maximus TaxID=6579 RepID=UPI001458DB14|nr:S-crystallin SL11-like isoform X2 [Pecten maximus]
MPEYRMIYFDGRGRAEPIRLALAVAGQAYEDKRIKDNEEWEKVKSDMPQEALPVFSVDGDVISQSSAILRYVAREYGLYGDGNKSMTKVDTIISTYEDFFTEMIKPFMEKDGENKKEMIKTFGEKAVPKYVSFIGKILSDNPEKSGWLVGSKLTVADIVVFCMFGDVEGMLGKDTAKAFLEDVKLVAHNEKVASFPALKEWLAKRPKTPF